MVVLYSRTSNARRVARLWIEVALKLVYMVYFVLCRDFGSKTLQNQLHFLDAHLLQVRVGARSLFLFVYFLGLVLFDCLRYKSFVYAVACAPYDFRLNRFEFVII